jgi:uncharacterized protein YndB with AHSA1/START domain
MKASAATASAKSWPAPQGEAPGGGVVRVSVLVPGTPEDAWRVLTERDSVACWFGDLSETLRPGGTHRLDFGDGDFFAVDNVVLDPPHRLAYCWRFLGTSPMDSIAWSIEPEGDACCCVTVADTEPSRTPAGCDEMIEGWTDFLQRLQDHCVTGQNTRYAWREEFGGSIELAVGPQGAVERLFSPAGQHHWLPWSGDSIASGAIVTMMDGAEPTRFRIGNVEKSLATLRFTLTSSAWRAATDCRIELQPWPSGSLLVIAHTGWPAIDTRAAEQATQRARFSTLWIEALRRAKASVAS